jgi:hypothetical protein
MRWRVKSSRYRPNWFHACEVAFLDAEDAHEAKSLVEADPELKVWAVTPATPKMEADYRAWKASCDAWIARNRNGESNRGQVIKAYG